MLINLSPINLQYNNKNIQKPHTINYNLTPLAYDIVSFGAMRKKEFEGIDLAVVQKFNAPIEKFNSNADLQNWAGEKAEAIAEKNFGGRSEETKIQRKAILKEWSNYVFNENDAYNNTTALLILNAITKNLKPDNDNIPPVLNKGVLADCIYKIDKNTKNDPKYRFDLNKMYQNNLRAAYLNDSETNTGETDTKWVIIPSKNNDYENFEVNVEKLKALSYKTWCTKSNNAEPYLEQGDFHVYVENGKPKLGVRFVGDEIEEIQGEKNNGRIPIDYFDIIQNHISENNLKLTDNAKDEIKSAETARKEIKKIKKDLKESIKNNDVKTIYRYFGINVKEGKTGYLTISEYKQPSKDYTFKDLGIDENKLIEKVKSINGNANFSNSMLTDLSNIKYINGNAFFGHSQVSNLGNLKSIGGHANFRYSTITSLGNLKSIGQDAYFSYTKITGLGNLESIGGNADFRDSEITSLGNLESIGWNAYFQNSKITSLGNLESIGWNAYFQNSKITSLGNLESIGGSVDFRNSEITSLGNLKSIGGNADFRYSKITSLKNLESIDGEADIRTSKLKDKDFAYISVDEGILK